MQSNRVEWCNPIHREQSPHHHAGYPEEQNVETGHQAGGRIERLQFGSLFRPSHGRKGPQGRGEPGVQHVGLLADLVGAALSTRRRINLRDRDVPAVVAEPGGNPVSPPDLARDAPVPDVFHPIVVGVFPLFRQNAGFTAFHCFQSPLGQW